MSFDQTAYPLPVKTTKPTEILECDQNTADNHVPRDKRLIRLTGIHPFNCEAPLSDLFDSGFLTPTELWYVRNHGAVPKVLDEDISTWKLTIEGLVEHPMTIEFHELIKYRQITIPVTLVCAGNRRKEQNIVRQGKGFNWGSGGVSTALFTGIYIFELLRIVKPKPEGKYMCMEGADQFPNGSYGTSIRLSTAMDPSMKVMLAYKMNGDLLTPDHGRPLRIVIPGQIGGRSVKWLRKIMITDKPSENWYHIFDNRVLPTMLTPEMVSKDESWWYDERYALYNLNVQSVICYPAHDEILTIEENQMYNIRGYAYSGGGIRISRVEISLDQGLSWKLTTIDYPEDLYRQGNKQIQLFDGILDMKNIEPRFCWCFWNLNVNSIDELVEAKDILVRAMDEHMNIQPRDMYWNVLSMLNNCWYRLTIIKLNNKTQLKFEHPIIPGKTSGGWMERVKSQRRNLTDGFWGSTKMQMISTSVKMTNDSITRVITEEELAQHNKDGDAWFAVHGHVYNATSFLKEHPGGSDSIIFASGADASEEFLSIHSDNAKAMLIKYHIGILQSKESDVFLKRDCWSKAMLKTKTQLNHDTFHLVFQLEHDNQKLGMPIGKHLQMLCVSESGEEIIRPYTPISDVEQVGQFELIIKVYRSFGKISACIERIQEGDYVQCKGPFGHVEYKRNRKLMYRNKIYHVDRLTMIAGGTGITPIYQVFRYARQDGVDCQLIYFNKTEEDILLRNELENLKDIRYYLSRADKEWKGNRGHISEEIIEEKHKDFLLLCCGTIEMEKAVKNLAQNIGLDVENQFITF